ncbi:MAG: LysR family transcriptional regulator [Rhizobium sp.]
MDRLASMGAFVTSVEKGSFAAAATALGMSQQMVAKHVTYLEARLGARLLNRTTRRQSLTEIGKTYYDRCKLVIADADWADGVAELAKGTPRGRLRINAPVSFGSQSLMRLVTRYLRKHPEVEIDLVLDDRYVDPVKESFEAVFRIGHIADTTLATYRLRPFRIVLCASPHYLSARGTPIHPADLEDHEYLGQAHWSQPENYHWRFQMADSVYEPKVSGRLRVNDAKGLLAAAIDGYGIAMIAHDHAAEMLTDGRLVAVLPDYETETRPMHLLFHPDRRQTPKLKSFIEAVMAEFGAVEPVSER